jgi:hypothetical protein
MRMRPFFVLPALGLLGLSAGCPRLDAGASPELATPTPAPAPIAAPAPAPAPVPASVTAPVAAAEPATPPAPEPPPDPAAPAAEAFEEPEPAAEAENAPAPEIIPAKPASRPAAEVPELASIAKETWIYADARWKSRRIGYLRAGAVVQRSERPKGRTHCEGGWYRIEPRGYVCAGTYATLDVHHPVVEAASKRPARDGLPYTYVMSRAPTPTFYARLPTAEEVRAVEPDIGGHLRKVALTALDPQYVAAPPPDPTPNALLYGQAAPALAGTFRSPDALVLGHAKPRSGFALLSTFEHDERRYGLTTELSVLPLDRARVVRPSSFTGLALEGEVTLPIAFVKSRHAARFSRGTGGALGTSAPLAFREAVPLTGQSMRSGRSVFLEARDGTWIREDQVVRIDPLPHPPGWAVGARKWIDVSILKQSLVAYEGTKPVYVTLVSTGADGLGDPKKTHSTVQGVFRIHTKHVSVTMDGEDVGDEFDLRDVPFVQYFNEGYALHAAYWHDDFGTPRSHGCVNLAPRDAAWVFNWTTPEVPETWHAALSFAGGTVVHTHP